MQIVDLFLNKRFVLAEIGAHLLLNGGGRGMKEGGIGWAFLVC